MLPMVNRRTFALGLVTALTVACNPASNQGHAHQVTDAFWKLWRDRFVSPEGRVIDTGNGHISHSEGQSYGMIFAYRAGDKASFERIANWTEQNLARNDMALFSWRYDAREPIPVSDPNNATDGDLVIAWAYALAGKRWSNKAWLKRSEEIRTAIYEHCVISRYGRSLLLPGMIGFENPNQVMLNPSYFVWPALDYFAQLDGSAKWGALIHDCEEILTLSRFGVHQLPSDWIAITGKDKVAPAAGKPPRFSYDAIRVPLYAAVGRRAHLVQPVAQWWQSYRQASRPIPAWIDVTTGEEAHYPLSNGGAAIAARLIGTATPQVLDTDYFAASLQMLARL